MFWAVDLDDFSGKFCNYGEYPLINSVKFHIKSSQNKVQTSTHSNLQSNIGISNSFQQIHTTTKLQPYHSVSSNSYQIQETTKSPSLYSSYTQFSSTAPYTTPLQSSYNINSNLNPPSSNLNIPLDISIQNYQNSVPVYNNYNFNSVFSNLDYELIGSGQATNQICKKDGLFADRSTGCSLFYQCVYSNTMFAKQYRFKCPENTIFNQNHLVCDWIGKTQC
jgi:hypothetical protein